MSDAIQDLWQQLQNSSLFTAEKFEQIRAECESTLPPDVSNEKIAKWLISKELVTKYQAKVLLAGQAGALKYGDYQVFDRVSKGPFSGCFQARHISSRYPVLLKFAPREIASDPNLWQQVTSQVAIQAQVNHPHVLRVFELVDLGSYRFAVLEIKRGTPLADKIAEGKRLNQTNATMVMESAAVGLQAIQHAGQVPWKCKSAKHLFII